MIGLFFLLSACSSTKTQESTGQYVDDTVLTTRVRTAIMNEPTVKSSGIVVSTFKGEVQLSGFADNYSQTVKAAEVAKSIPGVKSVKNDIRVK